MDKYEESQTDALKFEVFGTHRTFYRPLAPELMKWMNENWDRWEEEKPEWFNAKLIEKIPAEMLPVKVLKKLGGEEKRRDGLKSLMAKEKEEKEEKRNLQRKKREAHLRFDESNDESLPSAPDYRKLEVEAEALAEINADNEM